MALLLIVLALFGFTFAGSDSSSSSTTSPHRAAPSTGTTQVRKSGTTQVQRSVTQSRVTVHSSATAKSSTSCTMRVQIKGASVQTSRRCIDSPVSP